MDGKGIPDENIKMQPLQQCKTDRHMENLDQGRLRFHLDKLQKNRINYHSAFLKFAILY